MKNIEIIGYSFYPELKQAYITYNDGISNATVLVFPHKFLDEEELGEKLKEEYVFNKVSFTKKASKEIKEWKEKIFPTKKGKKEEDEEPKADGENDKK